MQYGPDAAYTLLGDVRDANLAALATSLGGRPARAGLVPGAIAWDGCDQCGLLALATTRIFLSDQFPIELTVITAANQGALMCFDMVTQVVRCAPQPQGSDLTPSPAALDTSAHVVNADAYAVLCSTVDVLSKLTASGDITDFLIRQQTFVGPQGACVGSELSFVVGIIR